MRTEAQKAERDAYKFHFTFPDPHQNISMDVPIASWRWSHSVCSWTALLCLASPCFTVVSWDSEGRLHFTCISPVTYMAESWISTREEHQAMFAKLLPKNYHWDILDRSNECLLSSVRVPSPSGMGYSTKLTFFQELLFKGSELRHGVLSAPCPYYSSNFTTSGWLLKNQEVWRLSLMTKSLQIMSCVCLHCSKIPLRFLEVPASLPYLKTMCALCDPCHWKSMKVEALLLPWFRVYVCRMKRKLIAKDLVHHFIFFLVPLFFFSPQRWLGSCFPTVLRSTLLVWLEPWPVVVIATQKEEIA